MLKPGATIAGTGGRGAATGAGACSVADALPSVTVRRVILLIMISDAARTRATTSG